MYKYEKRNPEERFEDDIQRGATIVDGKPIYSITVPYREPTTSGWKRKLQRFLFVRNRNVEEALTNHTYLFEPLVICNGIRIAKAIMKIPKELYGETVTEGAVSSAAEHIDEMVYIIAAAVQNNYLEPDEALIKRIKNSFTIDQILTAVTYSFIQLRMNEFVESVILLKGTVNIIKPQDSDISGDVNIVSATEDN